MVKDFFILKKLNLHILSLLLLGSSAFAMNQSADEGKTRAMAQMIAKSLQPLSQEELASQAALRVEKQARVARFQRVMVQSEQKQVAAFTPHQAAKQKKAAHILAQSFDQLPHNRERTADQKDQFERRLRNDLPQVVQKKIGEFAVKPASEFINEHIKELISCVALRHGKDLSMNEMVQEAERKLIEFYNASLALDEANRFPVAQYPYIIAMCGYWSFNDEPSKFRFRRMDINEAKTSDSDLWLAQRYQNNAQVAPAQMAIVNLINKDEFRAVLYSDGSMDMKMHPLRTAQLKMLSRNQLELVVNLATDAKNVSREQLLACRSLPSDARRALRSNYEISLSKADEFRHKAAKYSRNALKCAGAAAWLGGVSYFTSRHKPFPVGIAAINRMSMPIKAFMKFCWYPTAFYAWHGAIKSSQALLPLVVPAVGMAISLEVINEAQHLNRDRYRYPDNAGFWVKALNCTVLAAEAGFIYAACRGVVGYFTSRSTAQPGN